MKKLLLILTLILNAINVESSPIDVKTAMANATSFLCEKSMSKTSNSPEGLNIYSNQLLRHIYSSSSANKFGYPMLHIFNRGNDNGFIITAGDNCIDEVIAFSDEGSFDINTVPDNLKWWMDECERKMLYSIEHNIDLKHNKCQIMNDSDISPLLNCTWGQGFPFNEKCPLGEGDKKCYTGCIATALAQIMYYHKWPEYGNGYHEYICPISGDTNNSVTLSADFSNTKYEWNKMKPSYKDGFDDAESCDAVSTLMLHIGISLNMVYGVNGSSPTQILEKQALTQYFRYHADIVSKLSVPDDEFVSILCDELQNNRPVFVCGRGTENGYHAFVCDGYKSGGYFHFNWGWSGKYNAYFLASSMIPLQGYDYSYDHRIVYHIQPDYMPSPNICCPDDNHPHMIDLGLPSSTKWACCNVGANKPECYGGYYAWGETEEKEVYNWSTYIHCDDNYDSFHDLGSDIAGTQFDVAHVKWGGLWVMPTLDQIKELLDHCTYEKITFNGIEGINFKSKKNSKTIFLPAAGYRWDEYFSNGCLYWSSTQNSSAPYCAYHFGFISRTISLFSWHNNLSYGFSVRPVANITDNINTYYPSVNESNYVIYNLYGIKVGNSTDMMDNLKPGIYIVNGKKFIVR